MTISIEGASLLATLFPISMLVLLVEARAAGGVAGPEWKRGDGFRAWRAWILSFRNFWETITALSPIAALGGTVICAVAVCVPARINEDWSVWVAVCGGYQVVAVFFAINRLIRLMTVENHMASRD
ncbi:hypothetical protein [Curtobacterium pusillum]|uniref:hypothetical protein n=1 Tax=Curtobacterium pusillum TaxID=69373 RepID=UPI0011A508A4|nr:hypothetical protein [Curtobacterium pusillum]